MASVYFLGDPPTVGSGVFGETAPGAAVYVLPGATGYAATLGGLAVLSLTGTQAYDLGQQTVLDAPNSHHLYTTNQIHGMAIGELVLTRTGNGSFVLNYDIEQSEDLVNWSSYQGYAATLTNLPTNKAFIRIKAKQ